MATPAIPENCRTAVFVHDVDALTRRVREHGAER